MKRWRADKHHSWLSILHTAATAEPWQVSELHTASSSSTTRPLVYTKGYHRFEEAMWCWDPWWAANSFQQGATAAVEPDLGWITFCYCTALRWLKCVSMWHLGLCRDTDVTGATQVYPIRCHWWRTFCDGNLLTDQIKFDKIGQYRMDQMEEEEMTCVPSWTSIAGMKHIFTSRANRTVVPIHTLDVHHIPLTFSRDINHVSIFHFV